MKAFRLALLSLLCCANLVIGSESPTNQASARGITPRAPAGKAVADCAGGSCAYGTMVLNCPTGGTAACAFGTSCTCECNGGNPQNVCAVVVPE
jgi:hypothetical protein